MENAIVTIINSNLTEEEKEALLKELANESIKKQQAENSLEAKREQLIEKNRQKAQETRERLEQYQKEAYRQEIITNSDKEVQKYIEELSKIKNNRGEYIYKDLGQEYKDGKITKEEIYDLYERFLHGNREVVYEDIFKDINDIPKKEFQGPLSLEAAAEAMTIDEMNTILNMVSAETKDEEILNNIANSLGVSTNSLEEIANFKKVHPNKFAKASQNGGVNQSNDNSEPVSSVKLENPVKMPEKSIKKLQENIDRVQDEINADLKVVKKPLPKNIKQKVNEIKTSKPILKEKIQTQLATAINVITKIKEKIAELRENRENQKLSASEEQINQEESKTADSTNPAQEPITDINNVDNLEDIISKHAGFTNEAEPSPINFPNKIETNDLLLDPLLTEKQENKEKTEEEIYKIAGFNNPKTR